MLSEETMMGGDRQRFRTMVSRGVRVLVRPRTLAVGLFLCTYLFLQAPPLWFVRIVPAVIPNPLHFRERVLVIAPHPDDDILGVGSSIVSFREAGIPVLVVFLTSGDANWAGKRLITLHPFSVPSEFRSLGARRQKEAVVALGRLGVAPDQAVFLNYPDRGLSAMLTDHWFAVDPYVSPTTRRHAKYLTAAYNPGSAYCGEELLRDLKEIVWRFRPTTVYVPHPQDAHPDHRAGYAFMQIALAELAEFCQEFVPPEQRLYLVHYPGGLWPTPSSVRHILSLDAPGSSLAWGDWHVVAVSPEAIHAKYRALRAHASQWWTCGFFLRRFLCSNELYMIEGAWAVLSETCGTPD